MMTSKQKLFVMKLLKEIEELGYKVDPNELLFAGNHYDIYRTSKREASEDIDYLLKLKSAIESGKSAEDFRKEMIEAKKQEILKKIG